MVGDRDGVHAGVKMAGRLLMARTSGESPRCGVPSGTRCRGRAEQLEHHPISAFARFAPCSSGCVPKPRWGRRST